MQKNVTQKLDKGERIPINRYFAGSPIYPPHFKQDWNRSYILPAKGEIKGAVVFLHGLTDSPYSLRHIARRYRAHGYVSVAIRLPAHGTVPAALSDVQWDEWMAATRLAIREARRQVGPDKPLHLVGFSNGGALALKYALDAIEDPTLTRPTQLILISPMIGITRFARFAGVAGWPAFFPAFAKAAWLGIVPEFNPFKYNSFPVNGARQSYRLTAVLQEQLLRLSRDNKLNQLPPVLTFQSVMDYTVSTPAIVSAFYELLPEKGHELVLFDINRTCKFGLLLRRRASTALNRLLFPPPRSFKTTIVSNASSDSDQMQARVIAAGSKDESIENLSLSYPAGVYSLSHVAIPFPMTDSLYGLYPEKPDEFGVSLGNTATRGERNVLILSLDALLRMSSNPFYPYMIAQIEKTIH